MDDDSDWSSGSRGSGPGSGIHHPRPSDYSHTQHGHAAPPGGHSGHSGYGPVGNRAQYYPSWNSSAHDHHWGSVHGKGRFSSNSGTNSSRSTFEEVESLCLSRSSDSSHGNFSRSHPYHPPPLPPSHSPGGAGRHGGGGQGGPGIGGRFLSRQSSTTSTSTSSGNVAEYLEKRSQSSGSVYNEDHMETLDPRQQFDLHDHTLLDGIFRRVLEWNNAYSSTGSGRGREEEGGGGGVPFPQTGSGAGYPPNMPPGMFLPGHYNSAGYPPQGNYPQGSPGSGRPPLPPSTSASASATGSPSSGVKTITEDSTPPHTKYGRPTPGRRLTDKDKSRSPSSDITHVKRRRDLIIPDDEEDFSFKRTPNRSPKGDSKSPRSEDSRRSTTSSRGFSTYPSKQASSESMLSSMSSLSQSQDTSWLEQFNQGWREAQHAAFRDHAHQGYVDPYGYPWRRAAEPPPSGAVHPMLPHPYGATNPMMSRGMSIDSMASFSVATPPGDFAQPYIQPQQMQNPAEMMLMNLGFGGSAEGFLPERFLKDWHSKVARQQQQQQLSFPGGAASPVMAGARPPDSPGNVYGGVAAGDPQHPARAPLPGKPSYEDLRSASDLHRRFIPFNRAATMSSSVAGDSVPETPTALLPPSLGSESRTDRLKEYVEAYAQNMNSAQDPRSMRMRQFATSRQKSLPSYLETLTEEDEGKVRNTGYKPQDRESRLQAFLREDSYSTGGKSECTTTSSGGTSNEQSLCGSESDSLSGSDHHAYYQRVRQLAYASRENSLNMVTTQLAPVASRTLTLKMPTPEERRQVKFGSDHRLVDPMGVNAEPETHHHKQGRRSRHVSRDNSPDRDKDAGGSRGSSRNPSRSNSPRHKSKHLHPDSGPHDGHLQPYNKDLVPPKTPTHRPHRPKSPHRGEDQSSRSPSHRSRSPKADLRSKSPNSELKPKSPSHRSRSPKADLRSRSPNSELKPKSPSHRPKSPRRERRSKSPNPGERSPRSRSPRHSKDKSQGREEKENALKANPPNSSIEDSSSSGSPSEKKRSTSHQLSVTQSAFGSPIQKATENTDQASQPQQDTHEQGTDAAANTQPFSSFLAVNSSLGAPKAEFGGLAQAGPLRKFQNIDSLTSTESLEVADILQYTGMANRNRKQADNENGGDSLKEKTGQERRGQLEPAMISIVLEDVDGNMTKDADSIDSPEESDTQRQLQKLKLHLEKSGGGGGGRGSLGGNSDDLLSIPSRSSSISLSPIPQSPVTVIEVGLDNQHDSIDTEEGTGSSRDINDLDEDDEGSGIDSDSFPHLADFLSEDTDPNEFPCAVEFGREQRRLSRQLLFPDSNSDRDEEMSNASKSKRLSDASVSADDGKVSPLISFGPISPGTSESSSPSVAVQSVSLTETGVQADDGVLSPLALLNEEELLSVLVENDDGDELFLVSDQAVQCDRMRDFARDVRDSVLNASDVRDSSLNTSDVRDSGLDTSRVRDSVLNTLHLNSRGSEQRNMFQSRQDECDEDDYVEMVNSITQTSSLVRYEVSVQTEYSMLHEALHTRSPSYTHPYSSGNSPASPRASPYFFVEHDFPYRENVRGVNFDFAAPIFAGYQSGSFSPGMQTSTRTVSPTKGIPLATHRQAAPLAMPKSPSFESEFWEFLGIEKPLRLRIQSSLPEKENVPPAVLSLGELKPGRLGLGFGLSQRRVLSPRSGDSPLADYEVVQTLAHHNQATSPTIFNGLPPRTSPCMFLSPAQTSPASSSHSPAVSSPVARAGSEKHAGLGLRIPQSSTTSVSMCEPTSSSVSNMCGPTSSSVSNMCGPTLSRVSNLPRPGPSTLSTACVTTPSPRSSPIHFNKETIQSPCNSGLNMSHFYNGELSLNPSTWTSPNAKSSQSTSKGTSPYGQPFLSEDTTARAAISSKTKADTMNYTSPYEQRFSSEERTKTNREDISITNADKVNDASPVVAESRCFYIKPFVVDAGVENDNSSPEPSVHVSVLSFCVSDYRNNQECPASKSDLGDYRSGQLSPGSKSDYRPGQLSPGSKSDSVHRPGHLSPVSKLDLSDNRFGHLSPGSKSDLGDYRPNQLIPVSRSDYRPSQLSPGSKSDNGDYRPSPGSKSDFLSTSMDSKSVSKLGVGSSAFVEVGSERHRTFTPPKIGGFDHDYERPKTCTPPKPPQALTEEVKTRPLLAQSQNDANLQYEFKPVHIQTEDSFSSNKIQPVVNSTGWKGNRTDPLHESPTRFSSRDILLRDISNSARDSGESPNRHSARDSPLPLFARDSPSHVVARDLPRQYSARDPPRQFPARGLPRQYSVRDSPRPFFARDSLSDFYTRESRSQFSARDSSEGFDSPVPFSAPDSPNQLPSRDSPVADVMNKSMMSGMDEARKFVLARFLLRNPSARTENKTSDTSSVKTVVERRGGNKRIIPVQNTADNKGIPVENTAQGMPIEETADSTGIPVENKAQGMPIEETADSTGIQVENKAQGMPIEHTADSKGIPVENKAQGMPIENTADSTGIQVENTAQGMHVENSIPATWLNEGKLTTDCGTEKELTNQTGPETENNVSPNYTEVTKRTLADEIRKPPLLFLQTKSNSQTRGNVGLDRAVRRTTSEQDSKERVRKLFLLGQPLSADIQMSDDENDCSTPVSNDSGLQARFEIRGTHHNWEERTDFESRNKDSSQGFEDTTEQVTKLGEEEITFESRNTDVQRTKGFEDITESATKRDDMKAFARDFLKLGKTSVGHTADHVTKRNEEGTNFDSRNEDSDRSRGFEDTTKRVTKRDEECVTNDATEHVTKRDEMRNMARDFFRLGKTSVVEDDDSKPVTVDDIENVAMEVQQNDSDSLEELQDAEFLQSSDPVPETVMGDLDDLTQDNVADLLLGSDPMTETVMCDLHDLAQGNVHQQDSEERFVHNFVSSVLELAHHNLQSGNAENRKVLQERMKKQFRLTGMFTAVDNPDDGKDGYPREESWTESQSRFTEDQIEDAERGELLRSVSMEAESELMTNASMGSGCLMTNARMGSYSELMTNPKMGSDRDLMTNASIGYGELTTSASMGSDSELLRRSSTGSESQLLKSASMGSDSERIVSSMYYTSVISDSDTGQDMAESSDASSELSVIFKRQESLSAGDRLSAYSSACEDAHTPVNLAVTPVFVEHEDSRTPVNFRTPVPPDFEAPVDCQTPSKPVDFHFETPPKSGDFETPPKSGDFETSSKLVDFETSSKPVDIETPDSETPSKPVNSETPSKPVDSETSSKPFDIETPSKPGDFETQTKSVDIEEHKTTKPLDVFENETFNPLDLGERERSKEPTSQGVLDRDSTNPSVLIESFEDSKDNVEHGSEANAPVYNKELGLCLPGSQFSAIMLNPFHARLKSRSIDSLGSLRANISGSIDDLLDSLDEAERATFDDVDGDAEVNNDVDDDDAVFDSADDGLLADEDVAECDVGLEVLPKSLLPPASPGRILLLKNPAFKRLRNYSTDSINSLKANCSGSLENILDAVGASSGNGSGGVEEWRQDSLTDSDDEEDTKELKELKAMEANSLAKSNSVDMESPPVSPGTRVRRASYPKADFFTNKNFVSQSAIISQSAKSAKSPIKNKDGGQRKNLIQSESHSDVFFTVGDVRLQRSTPPTHKNQSQRTSDEDDEDTGGQEDEDNTSPDDDADEQALSGDEDEDFDCDAASERSSSSNMSEPLTEAKLTRLLLLGIHHPEVQRLRQQALSSFESSPSFTTPEDEQYETDRENERERRSSYSEAVETEFAPGSMESKFDELLSETFATDRNLRGYLSNISEEDGSSFEKIYEQAAEVMKDELEDSRKPCDEEEQSPNKRRELDVEGNNYKIEVKLQPLPTNFQPGTIYIQPDEVGGDRFASVFSCGVDYDEDDHELTTNLARKRSFSSASPEGSPQNTGFLHVLHRDLVSPVLFPRRRSSCHSEGSASIGDNLVPVFDIARSQAADDTLDFNTLESDTQEDTSYMDSVTETQNRLRSELCLSLHPNQADDGDPQKPKLLSAAQRREAYNRVALDQQELDEHSSFSEENLSSPPLSPRRYKRSNESISSDLLSPSKQRTASRSPNSDTGLSQTLNSLLQVPGLAESLVSKNSLSRRKSPPMLQIPSQPRSQSPIPDSNASSRAASPSPMYESRSSPVFFCGPTVLLTPPQSFSPAHVVTSPSRSPVTTSPSRSPLTTSPSRSPVPDVTLCSTNESVVLLSFASSQSGGNSPTSSRGSPEPASPLHKNSATDNVNERQGKLSCNLPALSQSPSAADQTESSDKIDNTVFPSPEHSSTSPVTKYHARKYAESLKSSQLNSNSQLTSIKPDSPSRDRTLSSSGDESSPLQFSVSRTFYSATFVTTAEARGRLKSIGDDGNSSSTDSPAPSSRSLSRNQSSNSDSGSSRKGSFAITEGPLLETTTTTTSATTFTTTNTSTTTTTSTTTNSSTTSTPSAASSILQQPLESGIHFAVPCFVKPENSEFTKDDLTSKNQSVSTLSDPLLHPNRQGAYPTVDHFEACPAAERVESDNVKSKSETEEPSDDTGTMSVSSLPSKPGNFVSSLHIRRSRYQNPEQAVPAQRPSSSSEHSSSDAGEASPGRRFMWTSSQKTVVSVTSDTQGSSSRDGSPFGGLSGSSPDTTRPEKASAFVNVKGVGSDPARSLPKPDALQKPIGSKIDALPKPINLAPRVTSPEAFASVRAAVSDSAKPSYGTPPKPDVLPKPIKLTPTVTSPVSLRASGTLPKPDALPKPLTLTPTVTNPVSLRASGTPKPDTLPKPLTKLTPTEITNPDYDSHEPHHHDSSGFSSPLLPSSAESRKSSQASAVSDNISLSSEDAGSRPILQSPDRDLSSMSPVSSRLRAFGSDAQSVHSVQGQQLSPSKQNGSVVRSGSSRTTRSVKELAKRFEEQGSKK